MPSNVLSCRSPKSKLFSVAKNTIALLGILISVASAEPSAADKEHARKLAIEGSTALDKKDYTTALALFEKAHSLVPAPTVAIGKARALTGLGRLAEAMTIYALIERETVPTNAPAPFIKAVESARSEGAALRAKVGTVIVIVKETFNAAISVDGVDMGVVREVFVTPGEHTIRASLGTRSAEATIKADAGSTQEVKLELRSGSSTAPTLPPQATPTPSSTQATTAEPVAAPQTEEPRPKSIQRTAGWITLGVGGAALATSGVLGLVYLNKLGDTKDKCPNNSCPESQKSNLDSVNTMGTVSAVVFYSGVGVAALGGVLLLTAPKRQTTGWTPYVGPASAGVVGQF